MSVLKQYVPKYVKQYLRYKSSSSAPHPQNRFEKPLTLAKFSLVNMTTPPNKLGYKSLVKTIVENSFIYNFNLFSLII